MKNLLIACPLALAMSCASSPDLLAPRFANAPVVTRVDDRRDVPTKPAEREFIHDLYHYDGTIQRRFTRALELPRAQRALGVNALDEVPDSTWFTNRIGVRDLTLDELRTGPARNGSPELHRPWTVRSTKSGGTEPGLMITDARGAKFLIKFDSPEFPEQETATHVIVGKLLWACGFNVTDDYVVYFRPADLVIARDAVVKDVFGNKRPMGQRDLDEMLEQVAAEPDGRIRALASLWLDGKPLGGHPAEGVRADDVNDRIPHPLRRDLRGMYAMFAWLDHVDVQEGNFIDMWVKDASRHYVKHYLLDFGKALGVMTSTARNPRSGHEHVIDFASILRSLVTAGAEERSWEGRSVSPLRGVGIFAADDFDPGAWKSLSPAYVPFLTADRFDKFWAAKILIRFSREQIRAIVETGRLSDPRAVEYLTDTLVARQRATARHWFERVNPLDHFTTVSASTSTAICFDDLSLLYQLGADSAATRYRVTTYDVDGRSVGLARALAATGSGHVCTSPLDLAAPFDGYTIVRVETLRPGFAGETFVHLARDPTSGTARVIGIWRP
ncbi:MAG TPA: hypothetical protein VGD80_01865 [Kofleriaceae bacterium]